MVRGERTDWVRVAGGVCVCVCVCACVRVCVCACVGEELLFGGICG